MIVANKRYDCQELLNALSESGLSADARVIYRGRNTLAAVGDSCVKSFGVPGLVKGLVYGIFRTPKAQRAYDNAMKLRQMDIDTPEPGGFVLVKSGMRLGRSYYVCRLLEGYSELRGIEQRSDFDALARALAGFMYRLHCKGVYFKDFTQGNILFRKDDDGYHFMLVDINRMEFGVADRHKLYSNFGSTLDTESGQRVLARHYAHISGDASLADELMEIYRAKQARLWRKRRFKEKILKSNKQ